LDAIECEWIDASQRANLHQVAIERMREQPAHWRRYYHSQGDALSIYLQYSLSDRIRYYWPDPAIEQARQRLFANLQANPPPIPLISQFRPHALHALRTGTASNDPLSLAMAHIGAVLDDYYHACHDQQDH
jgi:D-tagatose-1,6-bisphosphate aldolase subunit GatZ/KbaZ